MRALCRALIIGAAVSALPGTATAALQVSDLFVGNYGLSIDAVGSNSIPVGNLQASIPVGATVAQAYLYAAGTPYPYYNNSPTTTADYNGTGISLNGNAVTNFDKIVGADSTRTDIGRWYTGRADVTSIVQSLATGGPSYNWSYAEGTLNNRIDGGVLVIVYEDASLPVSSVALLDGGQDTAGETTTFFFNSPLSGVSNPAFFADLSLANSFSTGTSGQVSQVDINGTRISSSSGGYDDGIFANGGLITAGGIGDSNANPANPFSTSSPDDELYSLVPFLSDGDTSFSIYTINPSADDNIFFMGLHIGASISVDPNPVPEPSTIAIWSLLGVVGFGFSWRKRRRLA